MRRTRAPKASIVAMMMAIILLFVMYQKRQVDNQVEDLAAEASFVPLDNNTRLRIKHSGEENLGLPVVMEADLAGSSADFAWLQTELSRDFQVISYDRQGLGLSDDGLMSHDAMTLVTQLHQMLTKAKIPPPYILVGNGFGGILMQLYQEIYPKEVAALVLIDPAHPDEDNRLPQKTVKATRDYRAKLIQASHFAQFGLAGLARLGAAPALLPRYEQEEANLFLRSGKHLFAARKEIEALPTSYEQVRNVTPKSDTPLAVLSATVPQDPATKIMQDLHDAIARTVTEGYHGFVEGARRDNILKDRNHALQIAEHVRRLAGLVVQKEQAALAPTSR